MVEDQPPSAEERRVLFVNRYFYPDHSATAQILSDVAQYLSHSGFRVCVITSRTLYTDSSKRLENKETWEGVSITRVATTRFGRGQLLGRALDYLTFYIASFFSVLMHVRRGDLVISKTDPPLIGITVGLAARIKGARTGNWFQDVYPEVAEASGMTLPAPGVRLLKWARRRSIERAAINVAIGEIMADRLKVETTASVPIKVIHNFSDDTVLLPDPPGWKDLRQEWGFKESDFVVGYSGNLGRAHDVETVLSAADELRGHQRIKFVFVGGGYHRAMLENACTERELTNVSFRPYQSRDRIAQSLSVPDLHWISLRPEFEGLIVPSKLYGVAAVGRPVLMIGARDGEIGRLISKYSFGETIVPGDVGAATLEIARLSLSPHRVRVMGHRARDFVDSAYSRQASLERWREMLLDMFDP